MTAWDVDREIENLARRQHGVFSDRQAMEVGATRRIIRRRLSSGRWVALDRRVYALPDAPGTVRRQYMAASLAVDGSAVSHTSAAALHGLKGFRHGRPHIVVNRSSSQATALASVHRSDWPQIASVDGIRVVTLPDTFFQLVGTASSRRVRSAFEDAVVVHPSLLPAVRDRFVELAGRRLPGIAVVRELLQFHDDDEAPPVSVLEQILDSLLRRVDGLPVVQREAQLPGWDMGTARVDRLVPELRLIVEADGRRWHSRLRDFENDRWRDNVAQAQGYRVLRFTYAQLTGQPDGCLAILLRCIEVRPSDAA